MGFGAAERIPLDEKQKWLKRVERYNAYADKPIDPKKDVSPGPNAYPLSFEWKGKVSKKDKNKALKKHILDSVSKAPSVNAYYRKI